MVREIGQKEIVLDVTKMVIIRIIQEEEFKRRTNRHWFSKQEYKYKNRITTKSIFRSNYLSQTLYKQTPKVIW